MKVVTLNCWGLPWTSDYKKRMFQISSRLKHIKCEIVILQEIFLSYDIENFKLLLKDKFPYIHYFYGGFVGTGIMFLSKFPISDPISISYPQSGMIYHTGGDWFARKSICFAKILHPDEIIYLFGTHSHAKYVKNEHNSLRALQIYYLARFIKLITPPDSAIIVAGDLNTESYEISMNYLLKTCKLIDPYYNFYNEFDQIYTCNDLKNKYCSKRDVPCRIDYILHSKKFKSESYEIILKQIPSSNMSYSDHYGVQVEFTLTTLQEKNDIKNYIISNITKEELLELKKKFSDGRTESYFSFISMLLYFFYFLVFGLFLSYFVKIFDIKSSYLNLNVKEIQVIILCFMFSIFIVGSFVSFISLRCQRRIYKETLNEFDLEIKQY